MSVTVEAPPSCVHWRERWACQIERHKRWDVDATGNSSASPVTGHQRAVFIAAVPAGHHQSISDRIAACAVASSCSKPAEGAMEFVAHVDKTDMSCSIFRTIGDPASDLLFINPGTGRPRQPWRKAMLAVRTVTTQGNWREHEIPGQRYIQVNSVQNSDSATSTKFSSTAIVEEFD